MIAKSWNIRDQTEKELTELLEKKYKEIENDYKILLFIRLAIRHCLIISYAIKLNLIKLSCKTA